MKRTLICGVLLMSTLGLDTLPAVEAAQGSTPIRLDNAVFYKDQNVQYVDVVERRRRYRARRRNNRPTYYVQRRSKKKSAAIIGGSAAGGAAIGALAGGGKGAAIGAIAGGGAGLIYDRSTHKKVVRRP
jgi:outer membrane lipoprotein SlyB